MEKYEIAVQILDLSKKEEIENVLKEVSVKYIWGDYLSYGCFLLFNEQEMRDYKKFLDNNGLEIEQVHSVFGSNYDFSTYEQTERAIIIEATKLTLMKLSEIKVKNFVIHCSAGGIDENKREERINIFMDSLSRILPVAEKTGIKIAIENLPEKMIGTSEEIIKIIEEFNSPYLGVCFDTGHANIIRKFKEEFTILKDKIFTFHLHDNDGDRDLHLPPLQGTIDWKWFIKELKKSNYSGQLPIELYLHKGLKWSEIVSNMKKLVENDGEGEFSYCNRIIKII